MNLCAEGAVMQPFHSALIELYGVQLSQVLYGWRATFRWVLRHCRGRWTGTVNLGAGSSILRRRRIPPRAVTTREGAVIRTVRWRLLRRPRKKNIVYRAEASERYTHTVSTSY